MNDIKALEEKLAAMTPEQRAMISRSVTKYTSGKKGIPNSGPQTAAYFSQADVLLFGGKPGGGKSSLGCLLALNEHHRSLIVRAAFTDLEGMIDTAKKIVGDDSNFIGGSRPKYKKQDGGVIHFMGCRKMEASAECRALTTILFMWTKLLKRKKHRYDSSWVGCVQISPDKEPVLFLEVTHHLMLLEIGWFHISHAG
ncbi:MAG: hypothetical protein ABTQ25_10550 [Nitrosomonas ureae]